MDARPARQQVPDRDLRALSTADLLSLIADDIKELDSIISVRRRTQREQKHGGKKQTAREALDAVLGVAEPEEPEPESPPLHAVTCCNHHMGDFAPWARVRCPFCQEWHRAGDFPTVSNSART